MGSRADRTLKEIEELRGGLEQKLSELERRFPIAGLGRRAVATLAGGTAGGTLAAFALRRLRRGRRSKRKAAPATAPVVVNVIPKGAAWIAAAGVAVWAGARLYDALSRAKTGRSDVPERPAVVRPMPETGRQSGAGS